MFHYPLSTPQAMSVSTPTTGQPQRKRQTLAQQTKKQKTPKKVEKHVLDNPFKITWPRDPPHVTQTALKTVKDHVCKRYAVACRADPAICDVRGKRMFGHTLEREREVVFSLNCVTKLFEAGFKFKVILVEETLVPTGILDHVLYLCGLRKVRLAKGELSAYLSPCLGRQHLAIAAVPESSELTFEDILIPELPFEDMASLPEVVVRVVDATPSEEARKRLRLKGEKKAIKKRKLAELTASID